MKIAGAVPTPLALTRSDADLFHMMPDNCLSATEMKTMPFPDAPFSASSNLNENGMVPVVDGTDASESEESELGEFLLDAVQWL